MKIRYENETVESQCTSLKTATKLFGGNKKMAVSLLARINTIENTESLKDIITMYTFHFHNLQGNMKGYFAIDVKTRKDKWRIILQPIDVDGKPFNPCHIDEIAPVVKIVQIKEVSAHYE